MQTVKVTISGTGFAGDFTARVFGMIPHKNGVHIDLAGVTSGNLGNAERFAAKYNIAKAYPSHSEMLDAVKPDIDCIACANYVHAQYVIEAAEAGVRVIVLEKPPIIWPGYAEDREAGAGTRKRESMAQLAEALDTVDRHGARLLYAENMTYVDGLKALTELLVETRPQGMGKVLLQQGVCAHQGSHALDYDTPNKSGGGSLLNKACHPLGPALYLKQVEGLLHNGKPVRPARVSAVALQILKNQPAASGRHFRVMQQVDDYARVTVVFEDNTVAELYGYDLSISGILNRFSVIADFGQYDMRINPNDAHELFLPDAALAGSILMREKLPTPQGASFPSPRQFHTHGYVNEMDDALLCALDPARQPISGPMLAWDTLAVLMAGYESAENNSAFVDITEYTQGRPFAAGALPDPRHAERVLQRL